MRELSGSLAAKMLNMVFQNLCKNNKMHPMMVDVEEFIINLVGNTPFNMTMMRSFSPTHYLTRSAW